MQFNLEKEKQRVAFTLQKRDLPDMRASVGITLDVSGSTENLYKCGTIQRVLEQIIPIGLRFDDNGNLDVYTFSRGDMISQVEGATEKNYNGFVCREIVNNDSVKKWSGTSYAPIIEHMLEEYGFYGGGSEYNRSLAGSQLAAQPAVQPKKGFWAKLFGSDDSMSAPAQVSRSKAEHVLQHASASGEAVINYFITDGDNDDKDRTYRLLKNVQNAGCNIYFLFIGVGNGSDFSFIRKLGDEFNNVGFLSVADLQKFTDSDDIYEQLLPEELTNWLKQKKV